MNEREYVDEGRGAVLVRTSKGWVKSEGGEARDKEGACGEWESTALEEAVKVRVEGGDGMWQPDVGDGGKGKVDTTGAHKYIPLRAFRVVRQRELRIQELSCLRKGDVAFIMGVAVGKRERKKGGQGGAQAYVVKKKQGKK